jgi:hypothetical protein
MWMISSQRFDMFHRLAMMLIAGALSVRSFGPFLRSGGRALARREIRRVSPEIKILSRIDFFVDLSRVDAISGLLRNLMAAWKPKVGYFFFRTCHKDRSKREKKGEKMKKKPSLEVRIFGSSACF